MKGRIEQAEYMSAPDPNRQTRNQNPCIPGAVHTCPRNSPTCPSYDVKSLNVEKGQIQSSSAQPLLSGSLNDKGVLDGHMRMADGSDVPFQGRVHSYEYDPLHIHIDATIVDAKSGCGWTLGLVHE
jgi:hypothetical protein